MDNLLDDLNSKKENWTKAMVKGEIENLEYSIKMIRYPLLFTKVSIYGLSLMLILLFNLSFYFLIVPVIISFFAFKNKSKNRRIALIINGLETQKSVLEFILRCNEDKKEGDFVYFPTSGLI
ncbi:MAG: hypothetical protein P1U70_25050 [Saprospiraceae bacterium]|nr:hypothetical protein [Saprospiraceae bacterium]